MKTLLVVYHKLKISQVLIKLFFLPIIKTKELTMVKKDFVTIIDDNTVEINVGVCAGRHEMPIDQFIFDKIEDPTAVEELELKAFRWYDNNVRLHTYKNMKVNINLYITGLTVATTAILKTFMHNHLYAKDYEIKYKGHISLYHYNTATQDYYEQKIF